MTKYVIVTAISSYRMRYCIPVDELQKLNTEVSVEGREIEWANDCVTCGDAEEFSQHWIGENIIDAEIIDEEQMLNKFDADNDYLSGWTREKKLEYVRNWKSRV
jgi:hypothetical protein